ncbi:hypothetical protein FIBSPDRAFT_929511 [Athelia psychrophila]|uniref:Uncharacterized protein n=1 Tax=Athelia psychrophila TaxID=1759441 RepID=A0A166NEU9_9AGAM|nr:hypothetical protein FIBSPDRAFT_929511 [Fibularhizoctonia sp. CBS 109695]
MSSISDKPNAEHVAESKAPMSSDGKPKAGLKRIFSEKSLALVKLSGCMVAAVAIMAAGVVLSTSTNRVAGSATVHSIIPVLSSSKHRYATAMSSVFAFITTFITKTIGSVHSTALRSTLINERHPSPQIETPPNTSPPPNAKHRRGIEFNTNSRLFAAATGWANGQLMNALMALLLVISYAASGLIVMPLQILEGPNFSGIPKNETGLTAPPIILLGLSLFLQGVIALFGASDCGPYWTEGGDMLATTKKEIVDGRLLPRPHRCMRNVLNTSDPITTPDPLTKPYPLKPSKFQPSAWSANPSVERAVIAMWALIPFYAIWGAIIYALSVYVSTAVSKSGGISSVGIGSEKLPEFSWAFVPNFNTQSFGVAYTTTHAKEEASLPSATWPSIFLVLMVIQSGLTLALNYCEAIINTTQDEHVWRRAVGPEGASTLEKSSPMQVAWDLVSSSWESVSSLVTKLFHWTPNTSRPIGSQATSWRIRVATLLHGLQRRVSRLVSSNWRSVCLSATTSICHWLFGQSFQVTAVFAQPPQVTGTADGSYFIGIEVIAHCAQVWYLCAVLIASAIVTTFIANHKPSGPLPAAYGHFQTLADLIDEWPPKKLESDKSPSVLYWGHKSDKGGVCHAGTSPDKSLVQPIDMEGMYGGELDPEWPSTAG